VRRHAPAKKRTATTAISSPSQRSRESPSASSLPSLLSLLSLLSLPPLLAAPAAALAPSEIAARARAVAVPRGEAGAAAESAAVLRLGELVMAFIEQCEQAARAGAERRADLKPAFDALHGPLDGVYTRRSAYLESAAQQVMEEDGDLEALYETRQWREAQAVAVQALYYLNWLNFYGARLHDGARKKELLEAAEKGFGEFTGGERKNLAVESLLGRALCSLELGNHEWAIRDLRAVIEDREVTDERKEKAQLALLDAYARAGRTKEAMQYSQALLNSGRLDAGQTNVVRYFRLQALFNAMKGGGEATYRQEANALMDQLRKAGGGWADKVNALMFASIDNPEQWVGKADTPAAKWELANLLLQKGDEKTATPLLEAVLASEEPVAKEHHAEAAYFLGVARFRAGDYEGAAQYLTRAVEEGPKPEHAADAAYLQFKSLEALMAKAPNDARAARYEKALREFVQQHTDHRAAYEARYRLGELLQANGQFDQAIAEYEQVRGEPGFECRATFGLLQSRFEKLKEAGAGPSRDQLLQAIGGDLERFRAQAAELRKAKDAGGVPLDEFEAKAAVLQAIHVSLVDPNGAEKMLAALADFERRYPAQADLFAQVVRLRLGALQRLERWAEAEREVTQSAAVLREEGKAEALEKLATGFVKAGVRRKVRGEEEAAKQAEQVALRLYEVMDAGSSGDNKQKLTLARLYQSNDEFEQAEKLYKEILQAQPATLPALRGLAHMAESRKQLDAALAYWKKYTETVRPGDPPWYDGHYQQARLTMARGDKAGSCKQLRDLRPAMPGLGDSELRQQLNALYAKACG